MTVGCARLSDDRVGTELGSPHEREELVTMAEALYWREVSEYEDNDITADPRKAVRAAFLRLRRPVKQPRNTRPCAASAWMACTNHSDSSRELSWRSGPPVWGQASASADIRGRSPDRRRTKRS